MFGGTDNPDPSCRVCFCGPDPAVKAAGQLISPCNCTGSVRCIHLQCLRTWQATQRAQGRGHRANCCELCGCKYHVPDRLLQQEREQCSYLDTVQQGLKRMWQWCNDTAQGPIWQEAARYWRNALLVGPLATTTVLLAHCIRKMNHDQQKACCHADCWTVQGHIVGDSGLSSRREAWHQLSVKRSVLLG